MVCYCNKFPIFNKVTPIFKNQNKGLTGKSVSIFSVSTTSANAGKTSLSHGVHKPPQSQLGDEVPLLLEKLEELVQVHCWMMVFLNAAAKDIPGMFNWVKVRGTCWPVHADHLLLLQEVVDDSGTVGMGVVILEYGARTKGLHGRQDQRLKDVVPVAQTRQITLNSVEGGSIIPSYTTPHHDGPSTITITFLDIGILEACARSSPNPGSAIMEEPGKARFIAEQYSGPLLSGPRYVSSGPSQACHTVCRCQDRTHSWSPCSQINFS